MRKASQAAAFREPWGPFLKNLLAIALPVALQNLLATTGSMVDTLMLAQLGENTVAAVGLCAQFTSLMFSGYWGFVGGGMLFMSQYFGADDEDGVCRSFGLTLSFMLTVGIVFGIAAVVLPGTVMALYTDKTELWELGIRYLRIVGYSYPLNVTAMAISSMMRSTGRARIPLWASIVSLASNMILNILLIFGKCGFPQMGLEGAALATLIANILQVVMLCVLAAGSRFNILFRLKAHFNWTRHFIRHYLHKCFPILCNEVLIGVGNMVINVVLGRQSTQSIAALAVFRTFEGFVIAFFAGFTNASSVLVGNRVGAGEHELALHRAKRLIWMTPLTVFMACAIFLCFHEPFLHAMNMEGETFEIAKQLLFIFSVVAVIRMTNWINNDSFRAGGDATFGTVLEISFMYVVLLPCICAAGLWLKWPFWAVFCCAYIDEPIRLVLMLRHMFSGRWIRPVTADGMATIDAFREAHGIRMRERRIKSKNARGNYRR